MAGEENVVTWALPAKSRRVSDFWPGLFPGTRKTSALEGLWRAARVRYVVGGGRGGRGLRKQRRQEQKVVDEEDGSRSARRPATDP